METIEDDRVFGHVIKVRSLNERMTGVATVTVALVVGHDENDVWWGVDRQEREACYDEKDEAEHAKEVMKYLEGVEV